MVRYFEQKASLGYLWEEVATAYWRRYPNPYSTHVLSEDTIRREVRDGRLHSWKLLTKTNAGVPRWGEKLIPHKLVAIVEESIVDPVAKTLTTYTRNIGYNKVMCVVERVDYHADANNVGRTVAHRVARIDSSVFGLRRPVEAFGYERFKKNSMKALTGFSYVLAMLFQQGSSNVNTPEVAGGGGVAERFKEAARRGQHIILSQTQEY